LIRIRKNRRIFMRSCNGGGGTFLFCIKRETENLRSMFVGCVNGAPVYMKKGLESDAKASKLSHRFQPLFQFASQTRTALPSGLPLRCVVRLGNAVFFCGKNEREARGEMSRKSLPLEGKVVSIANRMRCSAPQSALSPSAGAIIHPHGLPSLQNADIQPQTLVSRRAREEAFDAKAVLSIVLLLHLLNCCLRFH